MAKRSTRDISLTVALCGSLVVHAALVAALSDEYVRSVGRIGLPALARDDANPQDRVAVVTSVPYVELGREHGIGNATDESPGDEEMKSPNVSDHVQPFLSLDPAGFGKLRQPPSPSALPQGDGAPSPENGQREALPFGVASVDAAPAVPQRASAAPQHARAMPAINPDGPRASEGTAQKDASPKEPSPKQPTEEQVAVGETREARPAGSASGRPGAPVPSANPAPMGETESDPFAVVGSVDFTLGKTEARLGRRHKLTAPRIDLAGIVDSFPLGRVQLQLHLRIDATGNVVNARVLKSSGSANIDQACRVEAYRWWFEPREGRDGKPLPSESFVLPIGFR